MKKLLLIVILFFSINLTKAQNWGGGIDNEDYNWGFSFQYISSEYKIIKKPDWRRPFPDVEQSGKLITDSLASISSPLAVGFGIGFVINTMLNKNIDLRFTPTLAFTDRIMDYQYVKPAIINTTFPESFKQQVVTATMIELPIGLKIKSDRRQNFRAYLLMGGKYGIDVASGKKASDADKSTLDKLLKNKKGILSYEAGIGFDLYFEYFKMSPEIKISQSIRNVLKPEDHPYSTPIDRAILRSFTFSLFFE